MTLTFAHIAGIVAGFVLIAAAGLYAGSKVKSTADFSTGGRKAGWSLVAGTLLGTFVGGASTIGTAQLAFQFGFSAWWYTIGGGIGFVILGLGMSKKFYNSSAETIPQFLVQNYSDRIGPISSIFTSVGIFLNLVAQVLSFVALMGAMFHVSPLVSSSIGVVFALAYVLFGGIWGTGYAGLAKLLLVYFAMLSCGIASYFYMGGISGFAGAFPSFPWFSMIGRGVEKDMASVFSVLVGILSTQTYMQAVVSAKGLSESRKGALAAAILSPPIGFGGILVGLFMRANFPNTPSAEVFPAFIMQFLPPVVAGIILGTLLITVIGTWAGLTLGVSTMFTRDIYQKIFRVNASGKETLLVQRLLIVIICVVSAIIANGNAGSLILGWTYLSQGLRGCAALFPLLGAMLLPRFVTPAAGVTAAILGPLTNIVWFMLYPKGVDPLYPGLLVSAVALIAISLVTRKNPSTR
ncbi:MAG: sodium:solute symporter family protein [Negativicutes bacterium]|nr:sodium:solute symporter family protein [Negativicutes bacterium]